MILLALPASAQKIPACVSEKSKPGSFDALISCQARKKRAFIRRYRKENASSPPPELLDYLEASQKKERANFTVPSQNDKDVKDLKAYLQEKSDGGKKGVTPEMADTVRQTLRQKQGGVSPEMDRFLNSVQKDGVDLTPETMDQIKGAAQQAHGAGLDLNVSPDMEKTLLNGQKEAKEPPLTN